MSPSHHRHHGSVSHGRITVVAGCVLLLVANGLIFQDAKSPVHPLPGLQIAMAISLIWIYAGAWAMCTRKYWGRYLVLTILNIASISFFLAVLVTLTTENAVLSGRLIPIIIALAIYLCVSGVLTHSRHVRRLTSRIWE